jgi:diadenylate cyclase
MLEIVGYISLFWEYIRNFVDIFIVAFVVYWVYKFLNKTKAISLLRGFIAIFVVAIGAQILRLDTMNWLIANLTSVLIITVIILFQPELRRLLMQFGQRGWLISGGENKSLHLDELVNAIYSMSETRTGALIVIERSTGLKTYTESGVTINATISEELICTIFYHLTPLHDGAIIIQNGIISAAACYLPLSSSKQLKKYHGSRHRAALGIAEETDALALVVSEENGMVSLAVNSNIYSRIKENELKNMILFYLNSKTAYGEYQTNP